MELAGRYLHFRIPATGWSGCSKSEPTYALCYGALVCGDGRCPPSIIGIVGAEGVDEVFWVEGDPAVRLAIVLCPRSDGLLKDDLLRIKRAGVQTLVSMLEPHEAVWLGLIDEQRLAEEAGLNWISYPIRDVHVPADVKSFRAFVADLARRLRAGERIGLHCRGSVGRAPTAAACALIHLGWKPEDAIAAIRAARGYPIPDTEEQRRWILHYKAQP